MAQALAEATNRRVGLDAVADTLGLSTQRMVALAKGAEPQNAHEAGVAPALSAGYRQETSR